MANKSSASGYHEELHTPRRSIRLKNASSVSYTSSLRRTATPFRVKRKTSTIRKGKHISFNEQAQQISNSFIEHEDLPDDKNLEGKVKEIFNFSEDEKATPEVVHNILNTTFDIEESDPSPGKDDDLDHSNAPEEIEQSDPGLSYNDGATSSEKSTFKSPDYKEIARSNQSNSTDRSESVLFVSEDESTLVVIDEDTPEKPIQSEEITSNVSLVLNQKSQEDCHPTTDQELESRSEDDKKIDPKDVNVSSTLVRFESGESGGNMAMQSARPILGLNEAEMTPVKIGNKSLLSRKKTPYHNKADLKKISGITKRANGSKLAKKTADVFKRIKPDMVAEILESGIISKNDTVKEGSLLKNQKTLKFKSDIPMRRKEQTEAKPKLGVPNNSSKKKQGSSIALRVKMPNFSAIHQQNFVKMESIDEHIARKADRAKILTSVNKIPPGKSSAKDSKDNKEPQSKARQKIDLNYVHNAATTPSKPDKAKTVVNIPKPVAEVKPLAKGRALDKEKPLDKVRSRQQKNMELYKGRSGNDKKPHKPKDILKGVRSNRRFELQMQHRDRLKSQDKN